MCISLRELIGVLSSKACGLATIATLSVALTTGVSQAQSVKDLQAALKAVGCFQGEPDGRSSLKMRTAVRCYQKSRDGWAPTGQLTDAQKADLFKQAASGFVVKNEPVKDQGGTTQSEAEEIRQLIANTNRNAGRRERQPYIDHVGFDLNEKYVVSEVVLGSPADIAGVKVGDQWGERIGNGILRINSWSRGELLQKSSRALQQHADSQKVMPVHFVRRGQRKTLWFPPVPLGGTFSTAQLSPGDRELFEVLPHDLSRFFSYVYLEDFRAAKVFQMAIFDKHFEGTASALVLRAFGTANDFREKYARSRGRGLFSQYILIKSNVFGMCGAPGAPIRVEQKRYEVWVDQFGIEQSARREIEPNIYEFTVPASWAGHLSRNAPMGEAAAWRSDILKFVEKAGGCDSTMLMQMERSMLRYLATAT